MATPIGSTNSVTDTSATRNQPTSAADKSALDKDAFLKLLVAQISHQDPLQPMQGTEFVAQLSQFAMVEQSIAQSSRLDDVSTQLRGIANNDATSLVGKRVTVRSKAMAFDGITATTSAANLDGAATKVTAEVVDASGRVVRTMQIGSRPAGACSVTWDGKDDSGNMLSKGSYSLRLKAEGVDGKPVGVTQDVVGTVTKVTFEKGYPELLLDNGATASVADLVGVQAEPKQTQQP